jgi:dienelactone hydrolase
MALTKPVSLLGAALVLALALLLHGCPGVYRDSGSAVAPAGVAGEAERAVRVAAGSVVSATGCTLAYLYYRPVASPSGDLVVLGHGFLRSKDHMAELARRLAIEGIPSVALDFCNMRFWDGGHEQNGDDMVAVARRLGARRVVYAGFSAGGLAAVVAAHRDERALGVVALDLVDRDGIGIAAATGLGRPLIGLVGEPSSCNAANNGLAVYAAAADAEVIRIQGASHCDFEAPTDALCRAVCEPRERTEATPLRARIIDLAVAAIESLLGGRESMTVGTDAAGTIDRMGERQAVPQSESAGG